MSRGISVKLSLLIMLVEICGQVWHSGRGGGGGSGVHVVGSYSRVEVVGRKAGGNAGIVPGLFFDVVSLVSLVSLVWLLCLFPVFLFRFYKARVRFVWHG